MADPVFVQPHFDDVALSCGGTVALLAGSTSPLIVTVFGGEPGRTVSDFARLQHTQWSLPDSDAVLARRREDADAAIALGASVRVRWIEYPEAIYRRTACRTAYGSEEALFGDFVPEDGGLAREIAGRLAELGAEFFLPMAVGNHVDHQVAFDAARELVVSGAVVWLYADLPYALDAEAFRVRVDRLGLGQPHRVEITREAMERRWNAIECYRSQLPVLFRGMDDPRGLFEAFGREDGGVLVERFWRLAGDERMVE